MDSDTFFVNIEPNFDSIPEVSFTTNFGDIDSIVIFDSIQFNYNIDIDTANLYGVYLYFEDIWIFESQNILDTMYIGPFTNTEDVDYTVTMFVAYKINTGSLADQYNIERMVADSSWTVRINQIP
jgi:hypothetical protein